jgi:ATP phosphoribosyltransferase regulatory subunit
LNASKYEKVNQQLASLTQLQETLVDYNVDDVVFFDFSLTKKIEYYTGMVFEASVPNLGLPIGSGGRYDNFIEKFGKLKLPATGFALEIDKILQALLAQGFEICNGEKQRVIVCSSFRKQAIDAVNSLRNAGFVASLEVTKRSIEKTVEYGKLSEADFVVCVNSSLTAPVTVYDLKSDVKSEMIVEEFIDNCGGQD